MKPGSIEYKSALSNIKNMIAESKRRGTNRGFIDYRGCLSVCKDLQFILGMAKQAIDSGCFAHAYDIISLVLIECGKLASTADDSAGGVTDTRDLVKELLKELCMVARPQRQQAEYIFLKSLKDCINKAFDGWDEFSYDLLTPTSTLASKEHLSKLYAVLDKLGAGFKTSEFSSWRLEVDSLIRYHAITVSEGEEAGIQFMYANLHFDQMRRRAVEREMDLNHYDQAVRLCSERIASGRNRPYSVIKEWYEVLFSLHAHAKNTAEQIKLARQLLLEQQDCRFFQILKSLLRSTGEWPEQYPQIMATLAKTLPVHIFMDILSLEGENSKLLALLRSHPYEIFRFGQELAREYPQETYEICMSVIEHDAAEANIRPRYKDLGRQIKRLWSYGGKEEARTTIQTLIDRYPRRPAMIEELQATLRRLEGSKS